MDVGETERVQAVHEMQVERIGVGVRDHAVEDAVGRQADAHPRAANRRRDRRRDLDGKAGAPLKAAAPRVVPAVGRQVQELVDEVAVGAVQLDPVEARCHRAAGRPDVARDGRRDVDGRHRLGHRHRLRPRPVRPHRARGRDRRRAKQARARPQILRVGDAAAVHELREDGAACRMHRVRDPAPAGLLRVREEARDAGVAEPFGPRRDALGQDQARRGPRAVVRGHEAVRQIVDGAAAGHRGHDDAVAKGHGAELEGGEERAHRRLRRRCVCAGM